MNNFDYASFSDYLLSLSTTYKSLKEHGKLDDIGEIDVFDLKQRLTLRTIDDLH